MYGTEQAPTESPIENGQAEVDPWEAAFAAVDKKAEEAEQGPVPGGHGAEDAGAQGADGSQSAAAPEAGDGDAPEGLPGGPDTLGGEDGRGDGLGAVVDNDGAWSPEQVESYRKEIVDEATNRAIEAVANAYIKKGARNTDGRLGATINDPDICKRDDDGVPHFYNPETGREFTGDNPRRQAQEWCDDYNRALKDAFNDTCDQYAKKLVKEREAEVALVEFESTYDSLDDVRRDMLDSLLENYEIKDEHGEVVGFDCDLNAMLRAVNRTFEKMQGRIRAAKADAGGGTQQQAPASAPALDMKSSPASAPADGKEVKSLADALLYQQDKILNERKDR